MKFSDPAYGEFEIGEKLLLDVLNTAPLQRLKGLNQYGTWQFILPKLRTSRLDHSLGVCHLLRSLSASLEEQLAGLVHDISHTAFSHVVDYIYGQQETQEHHEGLFQQIFMNSGIPKIVQGSGINPGDFLEMERFGILERAIPDLCADRLDCFLRDGVVMGILKPEEARAFIGHLVVHENEVVVDNPIIAEKMALGFMECSRKLWASPTQAASFQILADSMKSALEAGIISEPDFLLSDMELYNKMKSSRNPQVVSKLELLSPRFFAVHDPKNFDFVAKTKARYIDPKVLQGGEVSRLSEINRDYKRRMVEFVSRISQGYCVKIFPG